MNKFLFFLLSIFLFSSCQEQEKVPEMPQKSTSQNGIQPGMQRVKVNSRSDINNLINSIGNENATISRALCSVGAEFTENEDEFVSLYETKRKELMASLTPEQLYLIENDEDELEFCLNDSVIADAMFAKLLNADREIQVSDTVYKFVKNGVAYTHKEFANELKSIENATSSIKVTPGNEGVTQNISDKMFFIPMDFQKAVHVDNNQPGSYQGGSNNGSNSDNSNSKPSTPGYGVDDSGNPLQLENGILIPGKNVREVNYYDKGDGSWFHRTVTGLFGRNVTAIKEFSDGKKLTLNLYDQNYIIYASIGTKLKLQKQVAYIWWNVEAEEMELGWETVTLKYHILEPIPFPTHPKTGNTIYPVSCRNPVSFGSDNTILFHIPFIDYDFKTKDLYKAYKTAIKLVLSRATDLLSQLNKDRRNGMMSFNDKYAYLIYGPNSKHAIKKRAIGNNFYAKWLPGNYEFTFSVGNGSFSLKKINISDIDRMELYRASIYGAIKYNGEWLGARIIKDSDS